MCLQLSTYKNFQDPHYLQERVVQLDHTLGDNHLFGPFEPVVSHLAGFCIRRDSEEFVLSIIQTVHDLSPDLSALHYVFH